VLRQPASSIRGTGVLSDGERVIGEARYRLQLFNVYQVQNGPAGRIIERRAREVYGEGELLCDGVAPRTSPLILHMHDGRSISLMAIPHGNSRSFDIVPVADLDEVAPDDVISRDAIAPLDCVAC
jgi:hypothetical protein